MACTPPTNLFHVLKWSFEPTAAVEKVRYKWIEKRFTKNLKVGSRELPPELALLVFQHCDIREYAVAAAWFETTGPSTYSIDLLRGIWACYVMMNGTRYLASFSNKPSLNAKLILNAEKAADVHYMYVVEDHLGIQQVCFANSAPPIPHGHLEGLWWRMFSLRGKREFRIHTDVGLHISSL